MPRKKSVEPTYPSNSSRPVDIYRSLTSLQAWVMEHHAFFNDFAQLLQLGETMRINPKDRIFWLSEEQFCSMSVVHMHDVLLSLQRIREAFDEVRRDMAPEGDSGVAVGSSVAEMYFDVLCSAVTLLAVASVESEAKEAVYHRQVLEILRSLKEQSVPLDALCDAEHLEQQRMLEYVFRRK